jgi:Tfp pilus assembly protein PilN
MLGLSVAGALLCFGVLRSNAAKDNEYRAKIDQMESDIARLKGEGQKIQQQLSPEQQNLIIAAHKLVANKDFVWSRFFSDLESVMPGSVSASRIAVKDVFSDDGQVRAELDFGVLAHDYASVMGMIDQMNASGKFQVEIRGQDLQKTDRMTFTEYTLRVIYTPAFRMTEPTVDVAQNSVGGGQ